MVSSSGTTSDASSSIHSIVVMKHTVCYFKCVVLHFVMKFYENPATPIGSIFFKLTSSHMNNIIFCFPIDKYRQTSSSSKGNVIIPNWKFDYCFILLTWCTILFERTVVESVTTVGVKLSQCC